MIETLEELVSLHGISGYEDRVRTAIKDKLGDLADKARTDRLGNLYVEIGTGSPHLVLVAHMDEIGLVITYIEENGTLRFKIVGGLDKRVLPGRLVLIDTGEKIIPGVIGIVPPHLFKDDADRNRIMEADDMVIDVGIRSREETEALGIRVRNPVILKKDFVHLPGGFISARSLDDRAGCAVLLEVLSRLQEKSLPCRVTFAWTVQEEVGIRGATALASSLSADIVIPIDTLSAGDIPGVAYHQSPVKPGKGPALRFLDRRALATPRLVEEVLALAERARIPVQVAATGGGTDGAAFQLEGCSMLPVAFPLRYTHSPIEMLCYKDLERAIDLLCEIALNLDRIDDALQVSGEL
ncbi:M42 family metallopeptidase [Acidobacteriota bacterium]